MWREGVCGVFFIRVSQKFGAILRRSSVSVRVSKSCCSSEHHDHSPDLYWERSSEPLAVVAMIILLLMVLILYAIAIWILKAILRRQTRTVSRTPESTELPHTAVQRTEERSLLLWDDPEN